MSFDLNEAVFDEQGSYLEEKAVRYEEALMEQFAASPEGQAIKEKGTELGWGDDPLCHQLPWRDPTDDDPQRSGSRCVFPLPTQSHHGERGRGRDYPGIRRLLALSLAGVPGTASQAGAGSLDTAGRPTPGAGVAGASQLWHGQVLCPDGKGGGL